jgi:hypothetical protein
MNTRTTYTTDNRWSPGSSGALVPLTVPAAYSARWIDTGSSVADIVPDRQGVAYNDLLDRERLFVELGRSRPHRMCDIERDATVQLVDTPTLQVWARRSGGYVYVDAWLVE